MSGVDAASETYEVSAAALEDYVTAYAGRRFGSPRASCATTRPICRCWTNRLAEIDPPVLVLAGARDPMVPLSNAEFLAERLPRSELVALDFGHFTWEDGADAYGDAVLAWSRRFTDRRASRVRDTSSSCSGRVDIGCRRLTGSVRGTITWSWRRRTERGRLGRTSFAEGEVRVAVAALAAVDPVIARLAAETGPVRIPRPEHRSLRGTGAGDRLPAAGDGGRSAIHGRLVDALGGSSEPEGIVAMSDETMRAVGLSGAKTRSLHDLAAKVLDGTVDLSPRRLARRPDEEIVERLASVRGIGPWSADMFLIFQLRRLDVWPVSDLAIRRGYGIGWDRPTPTARELEALGDPYRPYRTVLAWYCWKADESRVH